jgi:hypothetical protein
MPCAPTWVLASVIGVPSLISIVALMTAGSSNIGRAIAFLATASVRVFIPVIAVCMAYSYWPPSWLIAHLASEAASFVGGGLNIARWPESRWPGAFDRGLQSHTLMHALTAINIVSQHWSLAQRAAVVIATPDLAACLNGHLT